MNNITSSNENTNSTFSYWLWSTIIQAMEEYYKYEQSIRIEENIQESSESINALQNIETIESEGVKTL